MRGIKPEMIPELVQRDVDLVEREAKIVIDITSLSIRQNPRPGLGIIAVVGPGKFLGMDFKKALLCEIGLGKSRPYHEAKRPGGEKFIQKRRRWFSLTEEQYLIIAPEIFKLLQGLADNRIDNWKCGPNSDNPFRIRVPRSFWSRHEKTLFQTLSWKPLPRGARFAVSLSDEFDEFLLKDIFWAELNLNSGLQGHLKGLARFIDLYLSVYKDKIGKNGFSRRFPKLKRVQQIREMIYSSSLSGSPYLLIEMLNYLPQKESNCLWPYITTHLIPFGGEETKERKLSTQAITGPESRLKGIQLRIKTGLDGRNLYQKTPKERDHVVFEIFSSVQ